MYLMQLFVNLNISSLNIVYVLNVLSSLSIASTMNSAPNTNNTSLANTTNLTHSSLASSLVQALVSSSLQVIQIQPQQTIISSCTKAGNDFLQQTYNFLTSMTYSSPITEEIATIASSLLDTTNLLESSTTNYNEDIQLHVTLPVQVPISSSQLYSTVTDLAIYSSMKWFSATNRAYVYDSMSIMSSQATLSDPTLSQSIKLLLTHARAEDLSSVSAQHTMSQATSISKSLLTE